MALTVETGAGVVGADSYAAQSVITAYWAARPHNPLAATWVAADSDDMDGAAREATAYLDATYGPSYRGRRAGYLQGLLWPRNKALDSEGMELPDLPSELVSATCELAGRALTKRLTPDTTVKGVVTSTSAKAGPVQTTNQYGPGAVQAPTYGFIETMLAPILESGNGWDWR